MRNQLIFALLILLPFAPPTHGQTLSDSVATLQKSVQQLQREHDSLKINELTAKELGLKIDKNEFELRKDYNWILDNRFTLGIAGLISLLSFIFGTYQAVTTYAIKKAEQKINQYYENEDNVLKSTKKILVLTPKDGSSEFIKKFFRQLFSQRMPDFDYFENYTTLNLGNFHLILVNDEQSKITNDEQLKKIIKQAGNSVSVLYFGTLQIGEDVKSCQQFSSVQYKSQIYSNLLNALRFQKILSVLS